MKERMNLRSEFCRKLALTFIMTLFSLIGTAQYIARKNYGANVSFLNHSSMELRFGWINSKSLQHLKWGGILLSSKTLHVKQWAYSNMKFPKNFNSRFNLNNVKIGKKKAKLR